MENPFHINYNDQADADLIALASAGNKKALESLIIRHQGFVYNLALKMTKSVQDAEDLTQEVFIRAVTSLSKFQGKSRFRTWLYRIAVNHFLNTKKSQAELSTTDFESYFNSIDEIPVHELNDQEKIELSDSIEELRISCTAGMLLCLDREQRMVYILGEMFSIDHQLGSEILGISPGNFRIRLMRARDDLYNWMNKRCGLVNESNPCRCAKKTKGYIKAGYVDPNNLKFNTRYSNKIFELSQEKASDISNAIEDLNKKVFLQHPFQQSLTADKIIGELFNNKLIRLIFNT
ncbi:MAG TPA: RNA polymerase sigma factor [Cyclobacteriaceae bacterium]|nr:RNA polymerase sigma factor [Cyclobacteriaceae bacterium]